MFTTNNHSVSKRKSKMKPDQINHPFQKTSSSELEEKLSEIMPIGKIAWWEFNIDSKSINYSSQRIDLLNYSKEEMPSSFEGLFNLIHESDRQKLYSTFQDYISGKITEHNCEYRIKDKDGNYRIFRNIGRIKLSSYGKSKIVSGIVIDITDYKKTEESLKETEAKFKLITENSFDEIWVRDLNLIFFMLVLLVLKFMVIRRMNL